MEKNNIIMIIFFLVNKLELEGFLFKMGDCLVSKLELDGFLLRALLLGGLLAAELAVLLLNPPFFGVCASLTAWARSA